jgi:methylated-DNA-[protein]-cysteine S-methyltransferase
MIMAKQIKPLHQLPIHTSEGDFIAWFSQAGLAGLTFPGEASKPASDSHREVPPPGQVHAWHALTEKALGQALSGQPIENLPPLDLSSGTAFQKSVWDILQSIQPGQTMSYAQIASQIGRPGAARAVGQACGANPVPVLVPCHRVLAANSRIGGFSGGAGWKAKLLGFEGVRVND